MREKKGNREKGGKNSEEERLDKGKTFDEESAESTRSCWGDVETEKGRAHHREKRDQATPRKIGAEAGKNEKRHG